MAETNPWAYARERGRDYLTPEDLTDAIEAGADRDTIWRATLDAISRKVAEDKSLCAFVALEMESDHG